MIDIYLTGTPARLIGRKHRLDVSTPAEAVHALSTLFPAFRAWLHRAAEAGQYIRAVVDKGWQGLKEDELHFGISESFHFIPVLSGGGGFFKILAGVFLAVIGFFVGGFIGAIFLRIGIGLALSGVADLLSPAPKQADQQQSASGKKSNYFTGPTNSAGQGDAIPIVYGKVLIGGSPISQAIDSQPL